MQYQQTKQLGWLVHFSPTREQCISSCRPSGSLSSNFVSLICVLPGIAGAEELLLIESNCVRIAVKPNLQAEESLAGDKPAPYNIQGCLLLLKNCKQKKDTPVHIHFLKFLCPCCCHPNPSFGCFSFSYIEGGFTGEAGDVWGASQDIQWGQQCSCSEGTSSQVQTNMHILKFRWNCKRNECLMLLHAGRGLQSLQTQQGRRITTCKKFCRSTLRTVELSGKI